jgi:hypothetical protein
MKNTGQGCTNLNKSFLLKPLQYKSNKIRLLYAVIIYNYRNLFIPCANSPLVPDNCSPAGGINPIRAKGEQLSIPVNDKAAKLEGGGNMFRNIKINNLGFWYINKGVYILY